MGVEAVKETGMDEQSTAAKTFQDLAVWQQAHQFVLGGYSHDVELVDRLTHVERLLIAYAKGIVRNSGSHSCTPSLPHS